MHDTDLSQWDTPAETTDLDVAFPARGDQLTPDFHSLPEEFRDWQTNPWCRIASALFYEGDPGPEGTSLALKAGIDPHQANRHLRCVLGTFSTKHEHKIAGAGYLLSRWFEPAAPTANESPESPAS